MADLLQILSAGAASLAAQRAAAATASHNLQNAATPGFARQRIVLEASLPAERVRGAHLGRGAVLAGVTQARDRFLEHQIPGALGQAARSSAASGALRAVTALDPEAPGGLGAALSGFYSALRRVSQDASDLGLRHAAIAATRDLALAVNRARQGIEDARGGIDAKLRAGVSEANDLARSVADLNRAVRAARAGAGEPNDLLDARQKAVDRLAELTGATPVETADGDLSLFLPGGPALVSGTFAAALAASPDPADEGHLSISIASGGPPGAAALGGAMGGLLDARDGALRAAVDGIDGLAFDLAGAVNAAHRAGFGLDGATGQDLLEAGPTRAGAAARLALASAVAADPRRLATAGAPGAPGDGGNALALVDTERALLSGGLDAGATLASVTGAFGAAARSASALEAHDGALLDHLSAMREAHSGVSIDEELVELQKAQRAFEAITRVIQASSEMFDTLLRLR